mgnify:CR=1 FL=1
MPKLIARVIIFHPVGRLFLITPDHNLSADRLPRGSSVRHKFPFLIEFPDKEVCSFYIGSIQ